MQPINDSKSHKLWGRVTFLQQRFREDLVSLCTVDIQCICCWFSQGINPDPVSLNVCAWWRYPPVLGEHTHTHTPHLLSLQAGNDKLGKQPQTELSAVLTALQLHLYLLWSLPRFVFCLYFWDTPKLLFTTRRFTCSSSLSDKIM